MTRAITGTPHQSWLSATLDITYYFNDVTLNIGCHGSCPISVMIWRVSEEHQSGVWIGGYGVRRGLWATLGQDGGLGAIFGGGVGWGVGIEGACRSVGDCWKGLRIRSTLKCLQNSEAVGVWRMLKVSKVGVGKTPRCFWSGKQVVPWQKACATCIYNYLSNNMASFFCQKM